MDWIEFILALVAGLVLLFAGRRFFWLVAGLVAFLFTFSFFDNLHLFEGWLGLVVAIILGAIFAWLATKFIKIVAYIIGALAGAAALPMLLGLFGIDWGWLLTAVIGAVIGFVLILVAFDWGLIVLTAWLGANVVSNQVERQFSVGMTIGSLIFLVLLVAGIVVQGRELRGK